jgi:hypothetical protein
MGQALFLTGSSPFIRVVPIDEASDDCYDEGVSRFLLHLQSRAPGAVIELVLSKRELDPSGFEGKNG